MKCRIVEFGNIDQNQSCGRGLLHCPPSVGKQAEKLDDEGGGDSSDEGNFGFLRVFAHRWTDRKMDIGEYRVASATEIVECLLCCTTVKSAYTWLTE